MTTPTPAADIVERLNARAAKIKGYIASSQIVVDLLAPQMKLFEERAGHDVYTVRMAVDHQSGIRTQNRELAEIEEAADEIARLRARVEKLRKEADDMRAKAVSNARERNAARARVEALENLLKFWAARKTVEEVLKESGNDEWDDASVERRIEMLGERRRAHDEAILAARAALHPTDEESRDA